jgi:hypothetical protein
LPGKDPKLGVKIGTQGGYHGPFWIGDPTAFTQACQLGVVGGVITPIAGSAPNCVAKNGADALGSKPGQISGPGFHRFDYSLFKNFQLNERFSVQFRSEFFNVLNHPNFNAPNFGGNGVNSVGGSGDYTSATFGAIGSTRDAPFDPRQIQFALKLYY